MLLRRKCHRILSCLLLLVCGACGGTTGQPATAEATASVAERLTAILPNGNCGNTTAYKDCLGEATRCALETYGECLVEEAVHCALDPGEECDALMLKCIEEHYANCATEFSTCYSDNVIPTESPSCDGKCGIDTNTDPNNCGSCGHVCSNAPGGLSRRGVL
jgi:hypothetical protein